MRRGTGFPEVEFLSYEHFGGERIFSFPLTKKGYEWLQYILINFALVSTSKLENVTRNITGNFMWDEKTSTCAT